jgi:hypothetical protein
MIDRQILRVQEQAKQLPAGNQIDPFEADDASDLKSPHTALRPPLPPFGSPTSQVQTPETLSVVDSSPSYDECIPDTFKDWLSPAESGLRPPVVLRVDDIHWKMVISDFVGCQMAQILLQPGQRSVLSSKEVDVDALVELYVHLFTKADGSGEPCEGKEFCDHKRRRLSLRLDPTREGGSLVADFVADPSSKDYIFEMKARAL